MIALRGRIVLFLLFFVSFLLLLLLAAVVGVLALIVEASTCLGSWTSSISGRWKELGFSACDSSLAAIFSFLPSLGILWFSFSNTCFEGIVCADHLLAEGLSLPCVVSLPRVPCVCVSPPFGELNLNLNLNLGGVAVSVVVVVAAAVPILLCVFVLLYLRSLG